MTSSNTENYVYVMHAEHAWVPATIKSTNQQEKQTNDNNPEVIVEIPVFRQEQDIVSGISKRSFSSRQETIQLSDYPNQTLPLQNINDEGVFEDVEDMVDLMFLHEPAILYNIKARHAIQQPYTRTGDVVIACNPYQWLSNLYCTNLQSQYSQKLVYQCADTTSIKKQKQELSPHVYETSALAFRGLALDGQHQSILVSGESGAGKTETVKICMNHIASMQTIHQHHQAQKDNNNSTVDKPQASDDNVSNQIIRRILDSNPLLEAFGNAKTRRNDNSSRFGKYIQLQFHKPPNHATIVDPNIKIQKCTLAGSRCEVYLLEKSRVIQHDEQERTFHIFYHLLAAPEKHRKKIWKGLTDVTAQDFAFVGHSNTDTIEGIHDSEGFINTIRALELVGIYDEKLIHMMRIICMVLQLGNIQFEEIDNDHCRVSTTEELKLLADLMGIGIEQFEFALTHRTVTIGNESTNLFLNAGVAKENSHALAKQLYSTVFLWLVKSINQATSAMSVATTMTTTAFSNDDFGVIGLLDIFGFESFPTNGFEQLCINYANEKLQSKFTQDVFKSVNEEYEQEGISLEDIHYQDNSNVLELIENNRTGLLAILNEECVLPKGNDKAFVLKTLQANMQPKKSSVLFLQAQFSKEQFGICHYAGNVVYDATNFVVKNMDRLPNDLLQCAQNTTNPILSQELKLLIDELSSPASSSAKRRPSFGRSGNSNSASATVWTKYKTQLSSLMETLQNSYCRYIRCIKPNEFKSPKLMQHFMTLQQLRSAGVVAAVTMSRASFPNRLTHEIVLDRFEFLWRNFWAKDVIGPKSSAFHDLQRRHEDVATLLPIALQPFIEAQQQQEKEHEDTEEKAFTLKPFVVGKTRTYFGVGALEYLEARRLQGMEMLVKIVQARIRGIWVRQHILNQQQIRNRIISRITLQCWIRQVQANKFVSKLRRMRQELHATLKMQCWIRQCLAKRRLKQLQAAVKLQCFARRLIARRILKLRRFQANKEVAALHIQCWIRMSNARQKLNALRYAALLKAQRLRQIELRLIKLNTNAIKLQAFVRGALVRKHIRPKLSKNIVVKKTLELDKDIIALQAQIEELKKQLKDTEKQNEIEISKAHEMAKRRESSLDVSLHEQGAINMRNLDNDPGVKKLRKENKAIRNDIKKKQDECKAFEHNIRALEQANRDASKAMTEARNGYLRGVVKHTKLKSFYDVELAEKESTERLLFRRQNQLQVECKSRALYRKTIKRVLKQIKETLPADHKLCKDIQKMVDRTFEAELRRRNIATLASGQDSIPSLMGAEDDDDDNTSEHSESSNES